MQQFDVVMFGGSGFIGQSIIDGLMQRDDINKIINIDINQIKEPDQNDKCDKCDKWNWGDLNAPDLYNVYVDLSQDYSEIKDTLSQLYSINFSAEDFIRTSAFPALAEFDKYANKQKDLEVHNPVIVFHLASSLGPSSITEDSLLKDFRINENVWRFMKDLQKHNKEIYRCFYFSTSEVYDDSQEIMDDNGPILFNKPTSKNKRELYKLQKLQGETLFLNENYDTIVLRIFNAVGPNQRPGFIISNYIDIFKKNIEKLKNKTLSTDLSNFEPFIIYGDGSQQRTFIHITDVKNIIMELIDFEQPDLNKKQDNQIINSVMNVANINNNYSINEVVIKFLETMIGIIEINLSELSEDKENKENKEYEEYINYFKKIRQQLLIDISCIEKLFRNKSSDDTENNITYPEKQRETQEKYIKYVNIEDKDLIGHSKRTPLTYKLYKVLKYKPEINMHSIIMSCI